MKEQLLSTLETSKKYTLAVAKSMPEDDYNFKPTGGGWNFSELLQHISYSIDWWKDNFILGTETNWQQFNTEQNKDEIIASLNNAYTNLEKNLKNLDITNEVVKGFYYTLDHITHHRGQAVIYLRCNSITPPEYIY